MQFPGMPAHLRGTFAALSSASVIDYLLRLGITAVELMPVHAYVDERRLIERGLRNAWGYNPIAFFAPHALYMSEPNVNEFRTMVRRFHEAEIEVILDVVYNHTAEGDHLGPTLSFRGIDNASYYRLAGDKHYYENDTGCGNTLKVEHPRVMQMVMDSLRYWTEEMHVDGFRFDLATTLGRTAHGYDQNAPFLEAIGQDPVLSRVKLIAEPWDLGNGRLSARRFSAGLVGVERQVSRRRPPLLAEQRRTALRLGLPSQRLARDLQSARPACAILAEFRDGARRLHAQRPGLVRSQAQ